LGLVEVAGDEALSDGTFPKQPCQACNGLRMPALQHWPSLIGRGPTAGGNGITDEV